VRGRLEVFAAEMFESMARKDQRRWGEVYLRGLMLDGRRKSIEPMAARLEDGDEQCLQQFVNQSPWAWEPVRELGCADGRGDRAGCVGDR
jgi:SRSO17 transposase